MPPQYCFVVRSIADFTGGTDPQTYTAVAQNDINNAANSLISTNHPNPQQVLQSQIKANEQLVGTPQCAPNKPTANHKAGDKATQVTVSVTFTCTGEVYDRDGENGALALAVTLLTQQAKTDPGDGYVLVGQIKTAITNASVDAQGSVTLTVSAEGTWVYQFSSGQEQALTQLIAGESIQDAQQLLSSQPGVAQASIQLSGGGQTLPSDP